jgi:hypothetical protein
MTPVTGRPSVGTETPDSNTLATDSRAIRQHPPRLVITGTSSHDFTGRQRSERNTEDMVEWVRHVGLDLFWGATTDKHPRFKDEQSACSSTGNASLTPSVNCVRSAGYPDFPSHGRGAEDQDVLSARMPQLQSYSASATGLTILSALLPARSYNESYPGYYTETGYQDSSPNTFVDPSGSGLASQPRSYYYSHPGQSSLHCSVLPQNVHAKAIVIAPSPLPQAYRLVTPPPSTPYKCIQP